MGLSRPFVFGSARVPLLGRRLIVPGRAGPRAEGAAQARHDARARLAWARFDLVPGRAHVGPINQTVG